MSWDARHRQQRSVGRGLLTRIPTQTAMPSVPHQSAKSNSDERRAHRRASCAAGWYHGVRRVQFARQSRWTTRPCRDDVDNRDRPYESSRVGPDEPTGKQGIDRRGSDRSRDARCHDCHVSQAGADLVPEHCCSGDETCLGPLDPSARASGASRRHVRRWSPMSALSLIHI